MNGSSYDEMMVSRGNYAPFVRPMLFNDGVVRSVLARRDVITYDGLGPIS